MYFFFSFISSHFNGGKPSNPTLYVIFYNTTTTTTTAKTAIVPGNSGYLFWYRSATTTRVTRAYRRPEETRGRRRREWTPRERKQISRLECAVFVEAYGRNGSSALSLHYHRRRRRHKSPDRKMKRKEGKKKNRLVLENKTRERRKYVSDFNPVISSGPPARPAADGYPSSGTLLIRTRRPIVRVVVVVVLCIYVREHYTLCIIIIIVIIVVVYKRPEIGPRVVRKGITRYAEVVKRVFFPPSHFFSFPPPPAPRYWRPCPLNRQSLYISRAGRGG